MSKIAVYVTIAIPIMFLKRKKSHGTRTNQSYLSGAFRSGRLLALEPVNSRCRSVASGWLTIYAGPTHGTTA
jgi:hypothetical protein